MAQLSSNSQGTVGVDGSGTHSSLLSVLNAVSYIGLMTAVIKNQDEDRSKNRRPLSDQTVDPAGEENIDSVLNTDIRQIEADQPRLTGSNRAQIEGREQKRLRQAPDGEGMSSALSLTTTGRIAPISRKEHLAVVVQVGDYCIKDSYQNLPSHFEKMPDDKRQALDAAMAGNFPSQDVSIQVQDEFGRQSQFFASTESNQGWQIVGEPSGQLSAQDMQQELIRQRSPGAQKIKQTMNELSLDDGPHIFSGQTLVVYSDSDEVIVIDKERGIVRDAVRLETIGNQGQQAVREATREAAAAFDVSGSAAKGIAPRTKTPKQRQLTP